MEFTAMAPMNKYTVWVSENEADYFPADLIISLLDEVVFYLGGKEVKRYKRKAFIRYNPKWVRLENTE